MVRIPSWGGGEGKTRRVQMQVQERTRGYVKILLSAALPNEISRGTSGPKAMGSRGGKRDGERLIGIPGHSVEIVSIGQIEVIRFSPIAMLQKVPPLITISSLFFPSRLEKYPLDPEFSPDSRIFSVRFSISRRYWRGGERRFDR